LNAHASSAASRVGLPPAAAPLPVQSRSTRRAKATAPGPCAETAAAIAGETPRPGALRGRRAPGRGPPHPAAPRGGQRR
jgi:hypothetical protein